MPSPTPLQIATSSLNRLVKEERSYRVEAVEQERRIQKIVDSPPRRKDSANPYDNPQGNWEFEIRQNVGFPRLSSPPQVSLSFRCWVFGGCEKVGLVWVDRWGLTMDGRW